MNLLKVDSLDAAFDKLVSASGVLELARVLTPCGSAQGQILAEDIHAREDVPGFNRSTMDGYALCAADTAAANESIPVFLRLAGQVEMGAKARFSIERGECAQVQTGGMLPKGADAVVMIEYTESFGQDGVAVQQSVSIGENVVRRGEDITSGDMLLRRGCRIGPAQIGAMAAAGVTQVPVYAPLRISIISTGDELVAPNIIPMPGQVRDINTYALAALAVKNMFNVVHTAMLRDDEGLLEAEIRSAMQISDIVIVSGGSSQGKKDATRKVIEGIASPGVFTHGLALKPGKPTILGVDDGSRTILAGLPGHPVSAMMVFDLLFCRLWRRLTGTASPPPLPAVLTANVPSSPGKSTCWPVTLSLDEGQYKAAPVWGKSGLITTLTKAQGYFVTGRNQEGVKAQSTVMVHLF